MEITVEVPDQYLVDHDPEEMGQRLKLYAALRMFESGELSAGAAAEFAQIDRFTFQDECRRHGVPLVTYPPEELIAELNGFQAKDPCSSLPTPRRS